MENIEHYRHLNTYLKNKFGERTLKICIDGGFTCPNRDGKVGIGGCIFCSERGSGDLIEASDLAKTRDLAKARDLNSNDKFYCSKNSNDIKSVCESISNQVKSYFASYKADRANKFIVYFQNFTNTYDSISNLKAKYDSALIDDRIVGLDIATRPDCIDENVCKLLLSYSNKYFVTVELGLQTSDDKIGELLNRGYSSKQFTNAVELLNKYHIDVIAHIMVGLPGESKKTCLSDNYCKSTNISCSFAVSQNLVHTVDFINAHNIQGIKIHSTYIVKNTKLNDMYEGGMFIPITLEDYLNSLVYVITHIRPNIIVHRVTGDAPKNLLVAPDWNIHKKLVLNGLEKIMRDKDLYQGMFCNS